MDSFNINNYDMEDYTFSKFIWGSIIIFGSVYLVSFLFYKKNDRFVRLFCCSLIFVILALIKYILVVLFDIRIRFFDYIFLLFSPPVFFTFLLLLIKTIKDRHKSRSPS